MPSASSEAEYLTGLHPLPNALWMLIRPSVNHPLDHSWRWDRENTGTIARQTMGTLHTYTEMCGSRQRGSEEESVNKMGGELEIHHTGSLKIIHN